MTTVTVKGADGANAELQTLSVEEIDRLLNDNNPQSRKQIMEHMKLLGRPVTELIKMKTDERKAFILERYAELGAGGKPKAKAGAPVGKPGSALAKPGTSKVTSINAGKPKAAPANPPPQQDADDEPQVGGDTAALLQHITSVFNTAFEALQEQITSLQSEVAELKGVGEAVQEIVTENLKFTFDTHFIARTTMPTAAGLSDDDVIAVGNENVYFGSLLVEVGEAAEGND